MTTSKQQPRIDVATIADTKTVKEVTKACKRYLVNKAIEERAKAKKNANADIIKKLGAGKYTCEPYKIDIIEKNGSVTINKEVFKALYPEIFNDIRIWNVGKPFLALNRVE